MHMNDGFCTQLTVCFFQRLRQLHGCLLHASGALYFSNSEGLFSLTSFNSCDAFKLFQAHSFSMPSQAQMQWNLFNSEDYRQPVSYVKIILCTREHSCNYSNLRKWNSCELGVECTVYWIHAAYFD